MASFHIVGVFFIFMMFFSSYLGQLMDIPNGTKNETQVQKSKLRNCGDIPDHHIQEICYPKHHKNRNKSHVLWFSDLDEIIDSMIGFLFDFNQRSPEKRVVRRTVIVNDCCTPSCIVNYIKKWLCADNKYKPAQLNGTPRNEIRTAAPTVTVTYSPAINNITTASTMNITVLPGTIATYLSLRKRKPYVEALNITRFE